MKELFEHIIENDEICFKYARGKSSLTGKEFHDHHEIILFLGGSAKLITEKFQVEIHPDTLIVIPKETYHQFIIYGDPENYYRCVLHFNDSEYLSPFMQSALKEPLILDSNENLRYLFSKLTDIANPNEAKLLLHPVTALVLNELDRSVVYPANNTENRLSSQIIDYINEHLGENINLEGLAKKFNLSPSSLSHIFKRDMNIPLHRYIIKKRLITAHGMIKSGMSASQSAIECGFNDYSGFYRQYKKHFGSAPSK